MCLLSTLSGLVDCLDKLSWEGRQFFNTLSSNDTALDNFSVRARDTGEWNLLRDELLREADFFIHLNKSMSELSFTTLHLEDNMRLKNLCYSSWNLFLSDALVLKLLKLRFFLLWHTTALFFQHESHSCQLGDRQNTLFGSLEVSHPFSIQVSTKSSDSISEENGVRSDFQSLTISKNLNSILPRVDCIYSIQVLGDDSI